jgi:hypothetical protein
MRRVRIRRRGVVVVALILGALVEVGAGVAVLTRDGDDAQPPVAAGPLHPISGSFKPDGTRLDDCDDQGCFQQAFGNIAFRDGPKEAIALLEREIGSQTNACHGIAHIIGSAVLARYDGDIGRTFAEGSSACHSGYYHGVLERAFLKVRSRDAASLGRVARKLCDDAGIRRLADLHYQCLHGLGHGLMLTTGYDLPVALRVCDHLPTEWEANSCNGGIFMENTSTSYGVRSRFVKDDDPLYPCNAVAKDDKPVCYQLVTSRILQVVGVDWEKVAEICARVERGWVQACFQSMGRDVSGQTHRDPEAVLPTCTVASPYGGERECVRFAAMDFVVNDVSGRSAATLCTSAAPGLRSPCFGAVGAIMGRFRTTPEARAADCRRIATRASDVAACIRGGRSNASVTTNG